MAKKTDNIIIRNVKVRPVNRINYDIQKWRNALKYAESENKTRYTLYDIYEEILLDGHLSSLITKRMNALTNIEMKFFDRTGKEVDEINQLINSFMFEKLLTEILLSKFWGFSLLQINLVNKNIDSIDRRYVKPEFNIVTQNGFETAGINYADYPDVLFAGDGDYGLLLKACPYVIFNRNNTSDWAEYNEIFQRPYAKGQYDNDDTEKILYEAFEKAGFHSYMVAPSDAKIELITAANSGSGSQSYEVFKNAMNEALSILILGQNLTTTVKEGSLAASQTHADVETGFHNADREFVIKTLNERFIPILQHFGYNADGEFKIIYTDELPLEKRILIDAQLANIIPIDDEYFYETYNIPKAKVKKEKEEEEEEKETEDKKLTATKSTFFEKIGKLFFQKRAVLKF